MKFGQLELHPARSLAQCDLILKVDDAVSLNDVQGRAIVSFNKLFILLFMWAVVLVVCLRSPGVMFTQSHRIRFTPSGLSRWQCSVRERLEAFRACAPSNERVGTN
uniref:Transmembrane protein n=1 Tax=Ascaris lumbricoides TaxID=6252 RepID=A0A0M3HXU5_ASCLU